MTKYPGDAEEEFPAQPSRDDSLLASPAAGAADAEETEPPPLAGMALLAADIAWARSAAAHWASLVRFRSLALKPSWPLPPRADTNGDDARPYRNDLSFLIIMTFLNAAARQV